MTELGKPEIGIEDISVIDVSASEIELLVSVGLDNGNPVAIPVEAIDFDILGIAAGKERAIAHGHYGTHRMPPGKSTIRVPVRIRNSEAIGSITDFIREGLIDLRVTGSARIGRSKLSYPVPFSEERRISL
jgi:LEA14-like dessication related protein